MGRGGGAGRAGDRPLLEALEVALPDAAVEAAIERTGTRERRRRVLPTHLVVTLVVAMGLWAEESVRHALATVVDGWAETRDRRAAALGPPGGAGPRRGGACRARRPSCGPAGGRASRLFRELFHAVAGPVATPATPGAFLGGLRLMAVDGTTLDVADTPENARAFGRPTTRRGAGAFPQLRVVALIETGTHALCDVVLRPFSGGEAPAARHLLRSVGPGMLLLWDRGFHGYDLIQRTLARGAHFLGRTKTNVVLPPAEGLPDGSYLSVVYPSPTARRRRGGDRRPRRRVRPGHARRARARSATGCSPRCSTRRPSPPPLLAATYHERWEVETALAEVKVHQWAHPRPLRSKRPRGVVQEVYGLLLAHLAVRTLMYQAALRDGVDPDRLSFTGALRVLRRAIPRAQRTAPKHLPFLPTGS